MYLTRHEVLKSSRWALNGKLLPNCFSLKMLLELPCKSIPDFLNSIPSEKKTNDKLSLVVDEYGSIAGMVFQEDLKEVVIGDIEDIKEKELYTRPKEDVVIADGKLELEDFMAGEICRYLRNSGLRGPIPIKR